MKPKRLWLLVLTLKRGDIVAILMALGLLGIYLVVYIGFPNLLSKSLPTGFGSDWSCDNLPGPTGPVQICIKKILPAPSRSAN
jgi:hypothetical protein